MEIELKNKNNVDYFSFFATGTDWIVRTNPLSPTLVDKIKDTITSIVVPFENKYSRFKDTSILSQLRNSGEYENPEQELLKMLDLGIELNNVTNGHFNLSIGNVLESQGYDKDYSFTEKEEKIENEDWFIEKSNKKIQIKAGTQLDFGSFGKGYLVDLLFDRLVELEIDMVLINAGGDIRYRDKNKIKQKFALENPFDPKQYIGTIELTDGAIASSSTNRRKWKDKNTGKVFTHLTSFKNYKEKYDLRDIIAIYTQAETCIIADAISTALFICPLEIHSVLEKKYDVSYLIIFENGTFFKSDRYSGILNL